MNKKAQLELCKQQQEIDLFLKFVKEHYPQYSEITEKTIVEYRKILQDDYDTIKNYLMEILNIATPIACGENRANSSIDITIAHLAALIEHIFKKNKLYSDNAPLCGNVIFIKKEAMKNDSKDGSKKRTAYKEICIHASITFDTIAKIGIH